MKLVYETNGNEVKEGDTVHLRDEAVTVTSIIKPAHGGSTGRVYVAPKGMRSVGFFPSVIGAKWIEREDQF